MTGYKSNEDVQERVLNDPFHTYAIKWGLLKAANPELEKHRNALRPSLVSACC